MTRYDMAVYDSPISLYDIDGVVPTPDIVSGEQRKARKNVMGKKDLHE